MKKLLLAALITALTITPLAAVAGAENMETSAPQVEEAYVPGTAPAEVSVSEAMSPAVHAVLLAMLNRDVQEFDPADSELAWEALYNMLSMYGQLDDRSVYEDDRLLVPSESVYDYAAAILPDLAVLGELPEFLADRMTYDPSSDCCLVVCGSDSLAELQTELQDGSLTGSLVNVVDNSTIAEFEATLAPADNMFGRVLTSVSLI